MDLDTGRRTLEPKRSLGLAAALILAAAVPATATAEPERVSEADLAQPAPAVTRLTVAPGQAELRRYSREPGTVILGDPHVAAASIATSDTLVLTGLRSGETNVIVLDDSGAALDHIALRVVEPGNMIVVRRGQERELLQCDPTCAPIDEPSLATPASRPFGAQQDAASPVAGEIAPPT